HLRRDVFLVRQDVGPAIPGMGGQAALLDDVHRVEPDLLPAALPRPPGDAPPLHRISRGLRLLELVVLDGRLPLLRLVPAVHRHRGLYPALGPPRDPEQLLERICRHAGMDPALAAARTYVRAAAQARGLGQGPRPLIPPATEWKAPGNRGLLLFRKGRPPVSPGGLIPCRPETGKGQRPPKAGRGL